MSAWSFGLAPVGGGGGFCVSVRDAVLPARWRRPVVPHSSSDPLFLTLVGYLLFSLGASAFEVFFHWFPLIPPPLAVLRERDKP